MHFVLRRLLRGLCLLVGVSLLSFLLLDLAPGNYFDSIRLNPQISPSTVNAIRSQFGLNRSFAVEYASWLGSICKGDWGFSLAYNMPVSQIIWQRAGYTLLLSGTATFVAWLSALLLGIWSAAHPRTWIERSVAALESSLMAIPELVLALLFLLLAATTRILPAGGASWQSTGGALRHLILPSLCLALSLLPLLLLHVRSSMRQALASPFVESARAYGIPSRRILLHHALPVAANPLLSLFGLSIGLLMSSSLVTETIFGWPGLGSLMVNAVLERDFFVVVDCSVLAAVFLLSGNLLADLLLLLCDPRVRSR